MSTSATPSKEVVQLKMKSRKRNFKKQKQKIFRASEPFISVFMWGVNHTIKELTNMRTPLMLMPDDFKAFSKIKIDNHIFNKENLPSHFKVKEYCPLVFKRLREIFGIDDRDYVNSLCVSEPVRVEDKGRSVARLLNSSDRRYVIKTLTGEDIAEMHALLPKYHQFIVEHNRKTLLPQYVGMYRLTLNSAEHYMMVMRNVLSPFFKTHKKYDLKGSTVQREASSKEKLKETPTFKDNDFVKNNVKICLDLDDRTSFLSKLKDDVDFLASQKLMDYSLLVGIHDCERTDRYSDHVFSSQEVDVGGVTDGSPVEEESGLTMTSIPGSPNGEIERADSGAGVIEDELYDSFYAFRAAASSPKQEVYYMGLIDILTHYDTKKKAAHAMKTAKHGLGADFSVKSPRVYADRLLRFIMTRIEDYDVLSPRSNSFGDAVEPQHHPVPSAWRAHRKTLCLPALRNCYSEENFARLKPDAKLFSRSRSLASLVESRERKEGSDWRFSKVQMPGAEISSIQPSQYSKRFYDFICEHVVSPETTSKPKKN